jgi:hypothetical protein
MDDDDDDSAAVPPGPRVAPGAYTVRLIVDGTQFDRPLRVKIDPRVGATDAELSAQFTLADSIYAQTVSSRKAMAELQSVEAQLKKLDAESKDIPPEVSQAIHQALARLEQIKDGGAAEHNNSSGEAGLAEANAGLGIALHMVESGHRAAPAQALTIFETMSRSAHAQIAAWEHFKSADLSNLNSALTRAKRAPVQIAAIEEQVHYAMTR